MFFGNHITIWHELVAAFALTVAWSDLRWRRIPRTFTLPALLAGLVFHVIYGGFLSALAAAALGLAVGVVLFHLKAIGGGDLKLICALGGMLGLQSWLFAMEIAVFAAAVIGIGQAIRSRRLQETIRNVGETLRWFLHKGAVAHPTIQVGNSAMLRAPFGVAAAVGTITAVMKF